jgi:hypothetical protein
MTLISTWGGHKIGHSDLRPLLRLLLLWSCRSSAVPASEEGIPTSAAGMAKANHLIHFI